MMNQLINHLWQSTCFAAAVALACLALRNYSPRLRYWLWLGASLKFIVPLSVFTALFNSIGRNEHIRNAIYGASIAQASAALEPIGSIDLPIMPAASSFNWGNVPFALWCSGAVALLGLRLYQWIRIHRLSCHAERIELDFPVPAYSAHSMLEPGVFGIFRPVLLLPVRLKECLNDAQLSAILAHERCHVAYRDNATAAIHMCIEAMFWFHPLVWWIGSRLIEEREKHCDESVLRDGASPADYAEGIVAVTKHYLSSPLACAAGVTGSDLRKRIFAIMTRTTSSPLTMTGKALLAAGLSLLFAIPVAIGVLRAQTLSEAPKHTYDVVSIRSNKSGANNVRIGPGPQGGVRTENTSVLTLLTFAYDVRDFQFVDVPGWVSTERYDVSFTPDQPEAAAAGPKMDLGTRRQMFERQRQRMQAVLRDRFGLVLREQEKELPYYAITLAKSGHKLTPAEGGRGPSLRTGHREMSGTSVDVEMLTDPLSNMLRRAVRNETGLKGIWDFKIDWTADIDGGEEGGFTIVTALNEQLGLKLESRKGPVKVFAIEKITKPTEN